MTVHTGTVHGGLIQLDDVPDLPDGRRVRVTVEPHPDSAVPTPEPAPRPGSLAEDPDAVRAGLERVFGVLREHPEEVEAFDEETRRLRRMTREEARRLRGEG